MFDASVMRNSKGSWGSVDALSIPRSPSCVQDFLVCHLAMDVDTRLLRYFIAVAEELNFTRAAARLHVSQPSLSKQIRQLERQVGAELLVRTSRSVSLTPVGAELLTDARELVAGWDATAQAIGD